MDLSTSSAVVTGGASGLGAATVRCLVAAGIDTTIVDLDVDRGERLAVELGERAHFWQADITDPQAVEAVVGAPREIPLRIMVNCAFVPGGARLVGLDGQAHDLAMFRRTIEVNLIGTFNCLRLGAAAIARTPPLDGGERGVIVNTSSIAAFDGTEGQCAYAAAKAGVAGLTLPAARDLRGLGIRVVTIAPGTFATPPVTGLPQQILDAYTRAALAPGRLGDPAEFGRFVLHACENSYLNGDTVRLDGGARLPPHGR
ncbi:putative enzyme [Frankia canadensis]|uniref:Putative enzyme n=1 Tax=Frankia canadensis TaxID=1836972 RepID=A0A2I2KX67_9ACTN|nr:SDR family NAD(P)-dependent oxidoreductase [Frankia canadensis]SNQ50254.1 putative enzyme [Frankia canadensis]SOU57544.1 putative enzyme [Frankia canadensis]